MVVDSMTIEEVANEILSDWYGTAYLYFIQTIFKRANKYRRVVMTSNPNKTIFFNPIKLQTSMFNRFTVLPYSINRSDFKKRGSVFLAYALINYQGHKLLVWIYSIDENPFDFRVSIFTKHSMERYQERFLRNCAPIDEMFYVELIKRNAVGHFKKLKTPKGEVEGVVSEDGIFLGERIDGGNFLVKTFISNNEFYDNQAKTHSQTMECIEDYIKETHCINLAKIVS